MSKQHNELNEKVLEIKRLQSKLTRHEDEEASETMDSLKRQIKLELAWHMQINTYKGSSLVFDQVYDILYFNYLVILVIRFKITLVIWGSSYIYMDEPFSSSCSKGFLV